MIMDISKQLGASCSRRAGDQQEQRNWKARAELMASLVSAIIGPLWRRGVLPVRFEGEQKTPLKNVLP